MGPRPLNIRRRKHLFLRLGLGEGFLEQTAAIVGRLVRHYEVLRRGKQRSVDDPRERLRLVQARIKGKLLDPLELPDSVHGYRRGRSTVTAARPHCGPRALLSVDIKDFYPSITSRRVYSMWAWLGCAPDVARLLTRLTTCNGRLPHGFITSPSIANLVRLPLDRDIQRIADRDHLTYTNYSDNLFLSGVRMPRRTGQLCTDVAGGLGWQLHRLEIRGAHEERRMLGLAVSDRVDVPGEYYRALRAEVRRVVGAGTVPKKEWQKLKGRIAYVKSVNGARAARLLEALSQSRVEIIEGG